MRYLLSIFAILFITSCTNNVNEKENKKVVTDMLSEFLVAIEKNDYDILEKLTHDEFVIYENGSVWDLEKLSTALDDFKNVEVKYTLGDIHAVVDENVAHLQFKNNGVFVYTDTTIVLDFVESATFIKENNNWLMRFYHSTHLKRSEE